MKSLNLPVILGLIFVVSLIGVHYLSTQRTPTPGQIYHPTDIVSPTTAPKNICMSNNECGSGKYCLQVCDNSNQGTCSPGKCVPTPTNAS